MTNTPISFEFLAEFSPSYTTVAVIPATFTRYILLSFKRRSNQDIFCPAVEIWGFLMALSECLFLVAVSLKYKRPHVSPADSVCITAS